MPPAPTIAVRHLSHAYGRSGGSVRALDDVSLTVEEGEFVGIVGPSGCGKSTLLRILAGLVNASSGEASVAGRTAYMPQQDSLLPWRRTIDNAVLGAVIGGRDRAEAVAEATRLLDDFGLAGFERSWPSQLSGGMRQRLALLRTFLTPADALLLDEPFGALDAITRRRFQTWLEGVWLADRRALAFVTHDVEEALVLSDRVLVLSTRPGRVIAEVPSPFPRPRPAGVVTELDFVARKAELLAALDA